jgi:hypothetical protein
LQGQAEYFFQNTGAPYAETLSFLPAIMAA